jgi:hypothetical protein
VVRTLLVFSLLLRGEYLYHFAVSKKKCLLSGFSPLIAYSTACQRVSGLRNFFLLSRRIRVENART